MTTPRIQNFEKMLAGGKDNTLLRFSLGSEYLKDGDPVGAATDHLPHPGFSSTREPAVERRNGNCTARTRR